MQDYASLSLHHSQTAKVPEGLSTFPGQQGDQTKLTSGEQTRFSTDNAMRNHIYSKAVGKKRTLDVSSTHPVPPADPVDFAEI